MVVKSKDYLSYYDINAVWNLNCPVVQKRKQPMLDVTVLYFMIVHNFGCWMVSLKNKTVVTLDFHMLNTNFTVKPQKFRVFKKCVPNNNNIPRAMTL